MRKLASVKAETKQISVKPKIVVKVDPNATTKQKVNLKKAVCLNEADNNIKRQPNTLKNIERLVEVEVPTSTHSTEFSNTKLLKSISINNGSSIQNRISKKQLIRNLDDSFWSNGSQSSLSLLRTSSPSNIKQSNQHGKNLKYSSQLECIRFVFVYWNII